MKKLSNFRKESDPAILNKKIAIIIQLRQEEIKSRYFSIIEKEFEQKQKGKKIPKELIKPKLKYLFERQINFLQYGRYELLSLYFENDIKLMTNFALPGRSIKQKEMLIIIKRVELFARIETEIILDSMISSNFIGVDNFLEIYNILNKLIYIIYEDIWISSKLVFSYQFEVIRKLLSKKLEAQEEEKKQLGFDLHNLYLQPLVNILYKTQVLKELPKEKSGRQKLLLNKIEAVLRDIITQTRSLSCDFFGSNIEKKGLLPVLRNYIEEFERKEGIPVFIKSMPKNIYINPKKSIIIFRIIQEAFTNINKHAKSKKVIFMVREELGNLFIEIKDDGIGFFFKDSLETFLSKEHYGIYCMHERVKSLGGSFKIDSEVGRGTKLYFNVPLKNDGKEDFQELYEGFNC